MKNAEYKEEFIKKLIKEITDNYSLSDIDEDEKSEFEELLKAELFTFNKKNIKDLLEDYGFNKEFMKKIVDKIPEIYA